MEVRIATESDREPWNQYIDAHSEVPPLARYEWCDILEHSHRVQTFFFLAEDDRGTVRGICATYVTKPLGAKQMLYSLRFGLLADDETAGQALVSHIRNFCSTQGIGAYLVTSGYKNVIASEPQGERGDPVTMTRKTVVLDILDSEEKMWNALRNKTRNMIRKAQNAGLIVERGFENLNAFYRIYARRMIEKEVPIHNQHFFLAIGEALKDNALLLVAKDKWKIVGGLLLLYGKRSAIYPYQASLKQGEHLASNQLLIWEAMRFCRERGVSKLDMGESREGSPVYQSKINFGGTPRDLYYYSFGDVSQSKLSALPLFLFIHAPLLARKKIGPWIKQQGRIM